MFDNAKAQAAIDFINCLRHTKGKYAGQRFDLRPWQALMLSEFFGTVLPDGRRQYRTLYIEEPRKNGKSAIGAGCALKLLTADGEYGGEVYSCAGDRDQASLVFNVVCSMIRMDADLSQRCVIKEASKLVVYTPTESIYKALSAESYTKHGLNASGVIFDELHVQPNRDLWDVMTTSMGAREQPAMIAITTAGENKDSVAWEVHEYAERVTKGEIIDYTFLAYIFSGYDSNGRELPWDNTATWYKANPALDDFRKFDELYEKFLRAYNTPAFIPTFKRLYLNLWVKAYHTAINMSRWRACRTKGDELPDLRGYPCWAGLDLASTLDIAALVVVFWSGKHFYVVPRLFVPEERARDRAQRDHVKYLQWISEGRLIATPGDVIDYDVILGEAARFNREYGLKTIVYDRWGAPNIIQQLQKLGIDVIPCGQGFASLSGPTKDFLRLVLTGGIEHDGNPVMDWQASNLVTDSDAAENVKPDKKRSTDKIDGIVALIMALLAGIRERDAVPDDVSVYDTRGIVMIGKDDRRPAIDNGGDNNSNNNNVSAGKIKELLDNPAD